MKGKHARNAAGLERQRLRHANPEQGLSQDAAANFPDPSQELSLDSSASAGPRRALSKVAVKLVRRQVDNESVFVFLYLIAMQLVGYALGVILVTLYRWSQSHVFSVERTATSLNGWSLVVIYLVSTAVAFGFTIVYRRSQVCDPGPYGVFHRSSRRMSAQVAVSVVVLALAAQAISRLYDLGVQTTIGRVGDSDFSALGILSSPGFSLPLLLYSCLWGPVVEEVVFRGAILSSLKRYGKLFAVLTSSFLFALLHGNLMQGFFAFLLGLILGFLGCEYSLIWPIFLHIGSNLAATYLPYLLVLSCKWWGLSPMGAVWGQRVFWLLVVVLALVALYVNRRLLAGFRSSWDRAPNLYASWATPWFLLVCAIQIALIIWRLYQ
ncbi:hypothetical protein KIM372_14810 [Bombiscardovia nodaiensis]|uniref:CAAX prenyl protease 2/Lysostaphin resistance protein A-like domain-containing protein n=1 Tax=Bombiscardovia nodaiensis TaxID=2932181 RepID=A0ABM8B9J6_9BIFI|nr:hypothetical protein KIM372_14810 [Bombiscardovia nodaiensis]